MKKYSVYVISGGTVAFTKSIEAEGMDMSDRCFKFFNINNKGNRECLYYFPVDITIVEYLNGDEKTPIGSVGYQVR